jgi:hypothetical protein
MGCLEAVLRYHGEPHDYVDLMGISGAAFRVRIAYPSSDRIMGGRIHPGISADAAIGPHVAAAMQATGYRAEFDLHLRHGEDGHEIIADRMEKEIDEGRPVIAMNLQGASCWGVVAGYDPDVPLKDANESYDGRRFLCRTYYDVAGSGYQGAPRLPWDVYFITPAEEPLSDDERARASLGQAADLLAAPHATVTSPTGWMAFYERDYVSGIEAYDAWIRDLADEEGIRELKPEQFLMYWQGHACMYDQLHDARRAAVRYLARIAPQFADKKAELLQRASQVCQQLVAHMTENWACFPFCRDGYVEPDTGWWIRVEQEEFLGQQVPAYSREWTADMRRRGTEVLRAVRQKDEEVLALLERLL